MQTKPSIKQILSIVCLILCLPLAIILYKTLGNSMHYIISFVVVILAISALFLSFEKRNVDAKEIVILAVMCTIAVIGRAVFGFLPFIKPIGAIIILTAVTMGPQYGFICGAMTMFASNFLFGQGPWTAWQMIAFGFFGFFAGIIFYNKQKKINTVSLIIYATASYMLFVGPLLDISGILFLNSDFSLIFTFLLAGIPVNFTQSIATAIFLLLLTKPFLEKIQRIKTKYGLLDKA